MVVREIVYKLKFSEIVHLSHQFSRKLESASIFRAYKKKSDLFYFLLVLVSISYHYYVQFNSAKEINLSFDTNELYVYP